MLPGVTRSSAMAFALVLAVGIAACGDSASTGGSSTEPPAPEPSPAAPEPTPAPTPPPAPPASATLTHDFGDYELGPGQEVASQCVSWTLDNEESLWVSDVTISNSGAFHHSNWFVVPEDLFPGPDGYWTCRDREFSELGAAVAGTVLFAQSTQSQIESQTFVEGAVIKVPPRHKVVAGVHMLNPSFRTITTQFRMTLGLVHPRDVEVLLTPFRLSYYALDIPPESEARYSAECDLESISHEVTGGGPLDLELYWVLPHYHYRGNYFRAEIIGGPRDGELLHTIERFDAEANGKMFDPPVDLSGAKGIRMTCGFENPTDEEIGWGIGDQEMCVMLGLARTNVLLDAWVDEDTHRDDGIEEGIARRSGACEGLAVPPNAAQQPPTAEEVAAPLYVPESLPSDVGLEPVLPCVDVPGDATPEAPVTFSSIRETVLTPSCGFSACHDSVAPAAGLDLLTDPHAELLSRSVLSASTDMPLVTPGEPSRSWLYQLLSQCEPTDDAGVVSASMPRNSPNLLDPAVVAKVRAWIEAGAPND